MIPLSLALIPLLLVISAAFAAAEASLFSLSRAQLETLRESRPALYLKIRALLSRPENTLSTIIIGNELINITIGTFVTVGLELQVGSMDRRIEGLVSVLIASILLLTFSEILPKIIAFRLPILTASMLVYPLAWVHFLMTPFRRVFLGLSGRMIRWLGIQGQAPQAISEQDFLTLVEVGAESGSLDRDEKNMIMNVFHFSDLTVSSIMTPWKDVICINETTPLPVLLEKLKSRPYSRVPVVSTKTDRVVGILYTKEILKRILNGAGEDEAATLRKATFPPYIVSTHKKLAKLFREFKLKKVHMALVVDEFGKQIGLVTLEDLLNALFHSPRKRVEIA